MEPRADKKPSRARQSTCLAIDKAGISKKGRGVGHEADCMEALAAFIKSRPYLQEVILAEALLIKR